MLRTSLAALWCVFVLSTNLSAQRTIFLVRHAERADGGAGLAGAGGADPSLSAAGHARAASLATMLKDAAIAAIFVTEFKRTQETAAPLAKTLGLTPTILTSRDPKELVANLKGVAGNALIVGHSNTVPEILKALGIATPISIGDAEYDNLFIVTPEPMPRLIRLHYQ